jgi:flavin-dependent dehydrogenase
VKILVVGGGTAGLISALILKKFLNVQVDVVYSKNIGIVGVGEGSTEHFNDFMQFVGIDQLQILKECDATFKSGIMFTDWSPNSYLHHVAPPFCNKVGQYPFVYAKQIAEKKDYVSPNYLWQNKIPLWFLNKNNLTPFNQYHFNTYKLNEFLIKIANQLQIKTIEDEINKVIFKENEEIDFLIGEKQKYNYDFYIDATGFKRLLIGQMGAKWISFGKYLKMKSAIVFPTLDEEEYNLWTLAKAMNYGWRFKIPTWGKHGNGYIFDSDYITADEAKKELDKEFGYDVEISKEFKFDPGYLEKTWIKNCVAIGLSGSFVEPLEATSIGSTIQQSYLLMHKIMNYSEKEIISYNNSFKLIMENIRDYIALHYITKKNNSVFWKDINNVEIPETLKNNLENWKNKMPIAEDFKNESTYSMFWPNNFILIMHGLNLFNVNSIKKEYEQISNFIKESANEIIKNTIIEDKTNKTISHKKYIEIVRNYL